MKKLLGLILVAAASCFGAFSSQTQWDVRPTGNDSNGGFFVTGGGGTDFSQQNSAQYTFADLASSTGTTNPCVVSSASHNFVAADVGNGLHISAGTSWTTGWYQIVSVGSNNATLDRACGAVASLTAGTYFVGGSLATLAGVVTATASPTGTSGGTQIGTVNIKSATYTLTVVLSITTSGLWQGYSVTHGDGASPPTITTATNSTDLIHLATNGGSGEAIIFDNVILSNTAGTPSRGIQPTGANGLYLGIRNATLSGFTDAINGDNITNFLFNVVEMSNVECKSNSRCLINNNGPIFCNGCYIHDNTSDGIVAQQNAPFAFVNSVSYHNGGAGITADQGSSGIIFCAFSDLVSNTGDGLKMGNVRPFLSQSCIYYGNGGWGVNVNGNFSLVNTTAQNNAFGANTSGPRNGLNAGLNDVTLTANPFKGATNFALNSTSGGGAALTGNGYPGTFQGGGTVSTSAIGAVQVAGGSSAKNMNSIPAASFQ